VCRLKCLELVKYTVTEELCGVLLSLKNLTSFLIISNKDMNVSRHHHHRFKVCFSVLARVRRLISYEGLMAVFQWRSNGGFKGFNEPRSPTIRGPMGLVINIIKKYYF